MCILCGVAAAGVAVAGPTASAFVPSPTVIHATTGSKSPGFIVASFVSPVLFNFYGLKFYSYGVFVALACLLAFLVFGGDLLRARIDMDEMNCFFIFLAGFGFGSKAHVVLSALAGGSPLGWSTFIDFIDLRTGHSFMGSIIGCVGFLLVYVRWRRARILTFLDVLLPCCLLGHAIGKIGCFMSGDGCYGMQADPTMVPWAMSFPNGQVPVHVPVHPTPIYEGTCSFLVFVIVRALFPFPTAPSEDGKTEGVGTPPKVGRRTALLLVLYGIERVICEQFRRHPPIDLFIGLSEYQALAVLLFLIGCAIDICSPWINRTEEPAPAIQEKKNKKNK